MSRLPFQRTIINNLEKPISGDINELQSQQDAGLREFMRAFFSGRSAASGTGDASIAPQGFTGDGFKVRPVNPVAMQVVVKAGFGLQDVPALEIQDISGIVGLDDLQRSKILTLTEDQTFNVPAPGVATRYDIIEVSFDQALEDPTLRQVLNTGTGKFDPATVNKTLSPNLNGKTGQGGGVPLAAQHIYYKVGVVGGGDPATDAGFVKIARIQVDPAVTTIDSDMIVDYRKPLCPGAIMDLDFSIVLKSDNTPGTMGAVLAPPGVVSNVVCSGAIIDGAYNGQLYVIAGGTPASAVAEACVGPKAGSQLAAPDRLVRVVSVTTADLSAPEAADLVDVTKTTTPLKAAVGQPRVRIGIEAPLGVYAGEASTMILSVHVKLKW